MSAQEKLLARARKLHMARLAIVEASRAAFAATPETAKVTRSVIAKALLRQEAACDEAAEMLSELEAATGTLFPVVSEPEKGRKAR